MNVPLLDLKAQYKSIKKELDEALIRIAESQYFILGPEVEKLENNISNYLNCKYSIGVSSGTDALLIALMALDINPGDEIIVPDYSFFSTAGVVSRLNAVPIFIDINLQTYNIEVGKIESKITPRTKAIIPVHLYGQSADMHLIMEIAKRYNLKVIEDCAQAIGTQYVDKNFVGTIGDIGCFSFFPSKNLGCFGDGGIVTTNDEELYKKLKILRVHGSNPKYYHNIIGGNFRLDALQSAILNVKLPYLDKWSSMRRNNAELYIKYFKELDICSTYNAVDYSQNNKILLPLTKYENKLIKNYHIFNQFIIRTKYRDELRQYLKDKEIGTEIYYPVPFHLQKCFSNIVINKYRENEFIFSNIAAEETIALPIYPELTKEQIYYVVSSIKEFFIQNKNSKE